MSTQPHTTPEPEFGTATETFTAGNAPQTFDPFNTRNCPELFEDKWAKTTDGITGQ